MQRGKPLISGRETARARIRGRRTCLPWSRLIPAISEATNAVHDANRIRKATPGPVSEYQPNGTRQHRRPQATTGRLRAVLAEYQEHYNAAGPHQGIDQRTPDGNPDAFHGTTQTSTPAGSAENLS